MTDINFLPPQLPQKPDVWVEEEDTYLVLSSDSSNLKPSPVTLLDLEKQAKSIESIPPGNIIIEDGTPPRILAIVHDLDQEPSWTEEWINSALANIFVEAERRTWTVIAMPCLAGIHGNMTMVRFVEILAEAFRKIDPKCVTDLWIKEPTQKGISIWKHLDPKHL
ncbi:MAG: hypothetical protein OEY63_03710 [Gemmatimonadota bacterium]|nr:hypothetical protein [Gemmatimonadota bacterium]